MDLVPLTSEHVNDLAPNVAQDLGSRRGGTSKDLRTVRGPDVPANNAPNGLPDWMSGHRTCICLYQLLGKALYMCPCALCDEENRVLWPQTHRPSDAIAILHQQKAHQVIGPSSYAT